MAPALSMRGSHRHCWCRPAGAAAAAAAAANRQAVLTPIAYHCGTPRPRQETSITGCLRALGGVRAYVLLGACVLLRARHSGWPRQPRVCVLHRAQRAGGAAHVSASRQALRRRVPTRRCRAPRCPSPAAPEWASRRLVPRRACSSSVRRRWRGRCGPAAAAARRRRRHPAPPRPARSQRCCGRAWLLLASRAVGGRAPRARRRTAQAAQDGEAASCAQGRVQAPGTFSLRVQVARKREQLLVRAS